MAQAEGPCLRAKDCAKEPGSALIRKLISPCACRVTFFERWRATTGNPRRSNKLRSTSGSGAVYSTHPKPSVPIGLSYVLLMISLARLAETVLAGPYHTPPLTPVDRAWATPVCIIPRCSPGPRILKTIAEFQVRHRQFLDASGQAATALPDF